MKGLSFSFLFVFSVISILSYGQCTDVVIVDPGFEEGSLHQPYGWWQDDGLGIMAGGAYEGDSMACSGAGGVVQTVNVMPFTDYYLSCYVLGGASDGLGFSFRTFDTTNHYYNIVINSDNWTLVSMQVTTLADTIFSIGYYSGNSCVDLFRMTCDPVINLTDLQEQSKFDFELMSDQGNINLSLPSSARVKVYSMSGILLFDDQLLEGKHEITNGLSSGIYNVTAEYRYGMLSKNIFINN